MNSTAQRNNRQTFAFGAVLQRHMGRLSKHFRRQRILTGAVDTGNRNQFRVHGLSKDACTRKPAGTGNRLAAKWCIHMDMTVCEHFCARIDHRQNNQITAFCIHLLARSQGAIENHGICQRLWRRGRHRHNSRDGSLPSNACIVRTHKSCGQRLLFPFGIGCAKGHRFQAMLLQKLLQAHQIDGCSVSGDGIQIDQGRVLIKKIGGV